MQDTSEFYVCTCRRDCVKWSCMLFWTFTGIIFILAAELHHRNKCEIEDITVRDAIIVLPVVGSVITFLTGLCGLGLFHRARLSERYCLKLVCPFTWFTAGIFCAGVGCVLMGLNCEHYIITVALISVGVVSFSIGGYIAGNILQECRCLSAK